MSVKILYIKQLIGEKKMRIKDKILMDMTGLEKEGPITIVAFGDSITHGILVNETNYETVYWNLLKKKINTFRDYIPVNVINAGIGGMTATQSLNRLDKQVLAHNPDLVIVCFGLNDINDELENYLNSLGIIFDKCRQSGADVIFMTPNMLNTYVSKDTPPQFLEYAAITAEYQNSGRMDLYMTSAVELANKMGVEVCDCYSKWKKISEKEDTTQWLINRINHPTPEMHKLFADSLFEIIFKEVNNKKDSAESTMYKG